MSGYVETIAGRIIFRNTDDFDSFCERYSDLFTSDDRIVSQGRGIGTPENKKDVSRELLVVRIPRLRFRMDFSPWTDDEVARAEDYGFVFTRTDGFYQGCYNTPDESERVDLSEWAEENDFPDEPEQDEFDSYDTWFDKHQDWTHYVVEAYHEAHEDVLPELPGTLSRDT